MPVGQPQPMEQPLQPNQTPQADQSYQQLQGQMDQPGQAVRPMPMPQQQPESQPLPPVQAAQADQSFDPSKSPSEQLGRDVTGNDNKAETHHSGASGVTKLPIKGLGGPMPAIILGFIVLLFLVMILLYAFVG